MSNGANKDLPQAGQNNEEFKVIQDEDRETERTVASLRESIGSNVVGEEVTSANAIRVPFAASPRPKRRAIGETSGAPGTGRGRGGRGGGGGEDEDGERYHALRMRASTQAEVKENKAAAQGKSKRNPKEK